jgi:transposase
MPFSKHQIDPAHIEAMRSAFQKACDALLLKCDVDDPMTEIIVNKIVALAKAGEPLRDPAAAEPASQSAPPYLERTRWSGGFICPHCLVPD